MPKERRLFGASEVGVLIFWGYIRILKLFLDEHAGCYVPVATFALLSSMMSGSFVIVALNSVKVLLKSPDIKLPEPLWAFSVLIGEIMNVSPLFIVPALLTASKAPTIEGKCIIILSLVMIHHMCVSPLLP